MNEMHLILFVLISLRNLSLLLDRMDYYGDYAACRYLQGIAIMENPIFFLRLDHAGVFKAVVRMDIFV